MAIHPERVGPHGDPAADDLRAVILPSTRADAAALGALFEASGIPWLNAGTVLAVHDALHAGAGCVLLSEEALIGSPAPLLAFVASQPVWSDLPIVVLSRSGQESVALAPLLAKLGNVTVVERPVRPSTLLTLVRAGLRTRSRQYQVREYLVQQQLAQQALREAQGEREQLLESERAARAVAERSSQMKDEFLATLSHELRTPLNAILGWTNVMRRSPGLAPELANGLGVVERNARAQAQIIEDLLDMSAIISGKVRLDVQRLALAPVVEATVETVRHAAVAKGIAVSVDVDPGAGPVRGDPNRLQQVFWNLLTNAVKFTPERGHVAISLSRSGSQVVVAVTDDGEGIDPLFLPHIFDRFRQADASISRRHGGLGLGLSIVKQLVELHGGTITARSAGTGQGSTFRVSLPLMVSDAELVADEAPRERLERTEAAASLHDAAAIDLDGVAVLVVDDEPDARALVERLLHHHRADVLTANSAEDALAAIARRRPDVLVSDIGMPGIDGYALMRRIRMLDGEAARIPAIALTAYARREDRIRAIQAGYQMHLAKPVEPSELVAMVQTLARRSG
jgi:signal transduction histidine kinase/ActR/RegA family two-component response regulator